VHAPGSNGGPAPRTAPSESGPTGQQAVDHLTRPLTDEDREAISALGIEEHEYRANLAEDAKAPGVIKID
jgi:hypothetical protein